MVTQASFLDLNGCHVFVTGGARGIGSATIKEFLENGCKVTAFDRHEIKASSLLDGVRDAKATNLHCVKGDLQVEDSIVHAFTEANKKFGPVQILVANAGIYEIKDTPIWDLSVQQWDQTNSINARGTFLTIKHFLRQVKSCQESTGNELENVSIIVTGSETGVFGLESHAEYASSKAGLQYGLVRSVKNEIVRLNARGRINAVAPGLVDTPLIGNTLSRAEDLWEQGQATVALKKIARPSDVACCIAFLASHRAAGHITGQCLSVDGGQEGRLLWRQEQVLGQPGSQIPSSSIPISLRPLTRKRRLRICLSVDFDALSGYLGTGHDPHNGLSDYSAGVFSANVGVGRLLKVLAKHGISDKLTWFLPGHSIETFPEQTAAIVASGAEIGLHGYSHEGAYAMTVEQEKDVLQKCIELVTELGKGKKPLGYRAPLYQIRETTVKLLQEHDFLYDSSMTAHDAMPYFLPRPFPAEQPHVPDYGKPAKSWMVPTPLPIKPAFGTQEARDALVEIPGSWYTEDLTPLGFYPYLASTQGYVSVDVVEKIWWDRFEWLWENESWLDEEPGTDYGSIYPLIWHPEGTGRAHIIGMIDKFISKLVAKVRGAGPGEITFDTMEQVATSWKDRK